MKAWQAVGGEQPEEAFAAIVGRYSQGRHYHDLGHIRGMFAMADEVIPERELSPELVVAVFLHDAVYDPQRQDNERRSAELARELLARGKSESVARICRMIEATKDHDADDPEAQLLIDLDLCFLGVSEEEFDSNVAKLVREFAHLERERFLRGQADYLKPFLDRPYIFYTEPFRRRFEAPARRNLERFIQANQELV